MAEFYPFSEKGCTNDPSVKERVGKRGERALELAELKLPVVPGFVLDAKLTPKIQQIDLKPILKEGVKEIEQGIGRTFGAASSPLLLKVVCSSGLNLPHYPTVFNIGLAPATLPGFAAMIGEESAWFEYLYLLRTAGEKLYDIDAKKFDEIDKKNGSSLQGRQASANEMKALLPGGTFPDDPFEQLERVIRDAAKKYFDPEMDEEDSMAFMVQGMVFGNIGEDACVGMYFTRNIISGEPELEGSFLNKSYTLDKKGEPIAKLQESYLNELKKIGKNLEKQFRELREVKFIVEDKKLWLINQTNVDRKSTQSHIRTLLDLMRANEVEDKWVVQQIPAGQLATLLHPIIDPASVTSIKTIEGGLAGSPGAAVGRVYFSADGLMEAQREALLKGEDTRMILAVSSSFAEDVKAIEVGQGVIAVEGGYSSHAPVVARSLGKVAMINPEIKMGDKFFELAGVRIKEGDYISMDVPVYRAPVIYLGKANLINPDIKSNGLVEFLEVIKKFVKPEFVVRANADLGRDALVAKTMGAYGIGLCRTEHMFFNADRIHRFREMILAKDTADRIKALEDLRPFQKGDFYDLFKTMAPYPVTIRLLDAPLHEFLPRNDDVFQEYCEYLQKKGINPNKKEIQDRIERLHEFNPMLGHRGCRVAITYPEIYEMQVRAIFQAAAQCKKEGINVIPEIMIPIVMNPNELTFIKNGKKIEGKTIKGIRDVALEVFQQEGISFDYKVGTMIELPAAALVADEISRYAEFFSFGTNDLTQTTFGLSRDDVNSFFPAYTEFDLLQNNPFQVLGTPVKELVKIASERGRLTRPDLKIGLCGEHGADPANIDFCRKAGLNYVSCSPYSVPIALLAVAQLNLQENA